MRRIQNSILVAFLLSLLLSGYVYGASELQITNVKVMEITPKKLKIHKSYVGYLKPQDRVVVRSETSGTVEKIHVDEGEKVKAGQVLVNISTNQLQLKKDIAKTNYEQSLSDYKVEKNLYFQPDGDGTDGNAKPQHVSLKQLKLKVDLTKAEYEHARNEYEIQKRLFEKNMASTTTYDTYKTTMDIKRITWQQAGLEYEQAKVKDNVRLANYLNAVKISEANLKLADLELEKSKVDAPFDGIVKQKIVQLGGFIQNGSDLVEIMDISKVLVRINIPENEMQFAAVGKPIDVKLDAMPGEKFEGTIKTLGLEADIKCRCFPADVVVDNKNQKLLPGMMARVDMLAISESNQVIVPHHAVLERLKGPVVFVVRNDKAEEVPVVTGQISGEEIQITQGLNFGDRLIIVGQDLLANHEMVKVVNQHQSIVSKN